MTPIELLINNITGALQRIRALLFIMTIFCSVVFSNLYIEVNSTDEEFMMNSSIIINSLNKEIKESKNEVEKGKFQARLKRLNNTLDDFKLRNVAIPFIGLVIPANDLNVIRASCKTLGFTNLYLQMILICVF